MRIGYFISDEIIRNVNYYKSLKKPTVTINGYCLPVQSGNAHYSSSNLL